MGLRRKCRPSQSLQQISWTQVFLASEKSHEHIVTWIGKGGRKEMRIYAKYPSSCWRFSKM
jgi:hypothetical protein